LEFASHCVLADILRRDLKPGYRFTHIASGEHRSLATGARLKRMGVVPGWPDFLFAGPRRHVAFLELKRKRYGKLSDEQKDLLAQLHINGFDFFVTDDVGQAVRWLQQIGVLRGKIEVQ